MIALPNLKHAIIKARSTQRKTAAAAGIPETRLSDIINGRATPSPDEQANLAKALRISRARLFGGDELVA